MAKVEKIMQLADMIAGRRKLMQLGHQVDKLKVKIASSSVKSVSQYRSFTRCDTLETASGPQASSSTTKRVAEKEDDDAEERTRKPRPTVSRTQHVTEETHV